VITTINEKLKQVTDSFASLANDASVLNAIEFAATEVISCVQNSGKILVCGNGGSAADAQHFVAEFIGRFYFDRQPLPAIALTTDTSILTCVANDYSYDEVFSRQVSALGSSGDVLIAISTSGNSQNVINAVHAAKKNGCKTVLLTGKKGGKLDDLCDVVIAVPSDDTPRIQEMHLFVEHMICELAESALGNRV